MSERVSDERLKKLSNICECYPGVILNNEIEQMACELQERRAADNDTKDEIICLRRDVKWEKQKVKDLRREIDRLNKVLTVELAKMETESKAEPQPLTGIALAEAACKACGWTRDSNSNQWWVIPNGWHFVVGTRELDFQPHTNLAHALMLWGMVAERMWERGWHIQQSCDGVQIWSTSADRKPDAIAGIVGTGPEAICRSIVEELGTKPEPGSTRG